LEKLDIRRTQSTDSRVIFQSPEKLKEEILLEDETAFRIKEPKER